MDVDSTIRVFAIFQNLDRAMLSVKTEFADIFIGRQAIAWGSARGINPTDTIAPFTFEKLDTEVQIGVDAARMRIPIGFRGELDVGYVFGTDFKFELRAMYLRSEFYVVQTDVSILLLDFRENLLVGFDVARAIGGAGFWFESSLVFDNALNDVDIQKDSNYLRAPLAWITASEVRVKAF